MGQNRNTARRKGANTKEVCGKVIEMCCLNAKGMDLFKGQKERLSAEKLVKGNFAVADPSSTC